MTIVWTPAYAVAAALLVVAGGAKVVRPLSTANAIGAVLGRRVGGGLVRAGAVVEAAVGGAALAGLRVAALALAVSYAGFAVFVVVALVSGRPVSSCGCFGTPDVPPTRLHVVIDLLAALAGGLAFVTDRAGAVVDAMSGALVTVLLVGALGIATYAAYAVLAILPTVGAAGR